MIRGVSTFGKRRNARADDRHYSGLDLLSSGSNGVTRVRRTADSVSFLSQRVNGPDYSTPPTQLLTGKRATMDEAVADVDEHGGLAKRARRKRYKNWCITWWLDAQDGPDDYAHDMFYELLAGPLVSMSLLVWQLERCPDTQKLHYQAYLECTKAVDHSAVTHALGVSRQHTERREHTRDQARRYCEKEATRVRGPFYWPRQPTFDEKWGGKVQGRRTDLLDVYKKMKDGVSQREIVNDHFVTFVRNHRGLGAAEPFVTEHYNPNDEVFVIAVTGDTGVGKSRWCHEQLTKMNIVYYQKTFSTWWDRYAGELAVVYEEFDPLHYEYRMLLRELDRYLRMLPVKGGSVARRYRLVLINSSTPFDQWYTCDMSELKRRVNRVLEFPRDVGVDLEDVLRGLGADFIQPPMLAVPIAEELPPMFDDDVDEEHVSPTQIEDDKEYVEFMEGYLEDERVRMRRLHLEYEEEMRKANLAIAPMMDDDSTIEEYCNEREDADRAALARLTIEEPEPDTMEYTDTNWRVVRSRFIDDEAGCVGEPEDNDEDR